MNRTTRVIVTTLGIVFALAGMSHGFFETLQGNTPTNGLFIDAIHASRQTWAYGGEGAFTIMPTFLAAGVAVLTVGTLIIIWSIRFIHTRHGATVFLLLFVLLFLFGGGIGQLPFFLMTWAFATRINAPLTWWRRVMPHGVRRVLAPLWRLTLPVGVLAFVFALEIAIWAIVPGVADDEVKMNIVMMSLGSGLLLYIVSFVSGFAHDIERTHEPQREMRRATARA